MNICLIGDGVTTLILATILANKNIKVSIFEEKADINKESFKFIVLETNILLPFKNAPLFFEA